ncbi:hypothetical protein HOH45_01550 [bacterium]|jgi:hypothetical protein|nr:hypothetical protein [bacterium]
MPLIEDAPKKKFKPKKRRTWDLLDNDLLSVDYGAKNPADSSLDVEILSKKKIRNRKKLSKTSKIKTVDTEDVMCKTIAKSDIKRTGIPNLDTTTKIVEETSSEVRIKKSSNSLSISEFQRQNAWEVSRISNLKGVQYQLLICLYHHCSPSDNFITSEISPSELAIYSSTSIPSVKKSISRLVSKGLLLKDSFKPGPSGWTKYILQKYLYQSILEMLLNQSEINNGE